MLKRLLVESNGSKANYSQTLLLLGAACILSLGSCANDSGSEGDAAGVQKEITPEGGTLIFDDVEIVFPPGSVADTTTVTVSAGTPTADVDDDARISAAVTIEIAAEVLLPIVVRMQAAVILAGKPTGVVASESFALSDERETTAVRVVDMPQATSADGKTLQMTLFDHASGIKKFKLYASASSGNVPITRRFTIWFVQGYDYLESAHFGILYPVKSCNSLTMRDALEDAETAYSLLTDTLGFDPRVSTPGVPAPLPIFIKNLPQERFGETSYGASAVLLGSESLRVNLNAAFCGSLSADQRLTSKVTLGHEIFHAFQFVYDPHWWVTELEPVSYLQTEFGWFYEASSVWFETLVAGSGYVSDQMTKYNTFVVGGLERGGQLGNELCTKAQHGYGASAFLLHLTDKRGSAFVQTIWYNILRGVPGSSSTTKILSNLGVDVAAEWLEFSEKYLSGTTGRTGWNLPGSDYSLVYSTANPTPSISFETYDLSSRAIILKTPSITVPTQMEIAVSPLDLNGFIYNGITPQKSFSGTTTLTFDASQKSLRLIVVDDTSAEPFLGTRSATVKLSATTDTDADTDTGTADDTCWLDATSGLCWDVSVPALEYMQQNAVAYCDNLTLDGRTDWRLPTISELRTLVQGCAGSQTGGACGVTDSCLADTCLSTDVCMCTSPMAGPGPGGCYATSPVISTCGNYWSSSVLNGYPDFAWYINFSYGQVSQTGNGAYYVTRCVRTAS